METSIDGKLDIECCDSEPFFTIDGRALYFLLEDAFTKEGIKPGDSVIIVIYKDDRKGLG